MLVSNTYLSFLPAQSHASATPAANALVEKKLVAAMSGICTAGTVRRTYCGCARPGDTNRRQLLHTPSVTA